jgi:hypothetical protein
MQPLQSKNIAALRYGGIIGLVYCAVLFITYLFGHEFFFGTVRGVVYLVLWSGIIYLAVQLRNSQPDEPFSYSDALLVLVLMYICAETIWSIGNYVLFNFVDTSLADSLKQISIDKTVEMSSKFGAPEDKMDEITAQLEKEDFSFSANKLIQSIFTYLTIGLIISSIAAIFIKKKKEESVF